jgi:sugar-specific transcriptional regulator TrmB
LTLEDEISQILRQLGFTNSQATVYLTLLKLHIADGKTISKVSKKARQEVYRILAELEEKSLIERIITSPIEFEPVPIKDCLSSLIEQRRKEIFEIEKKAQESLQQFKETKANVLQDNTQFILIPKKKTLLRRLKTAIATTQNSISCVCSGHGCLHPLFDLSPTFQKALGRGVAIRWILDKQLDIDMDSLPMNLRFLLENPLFKLGVVTSQVKEKIFIYDQKELYLSLYPDRDYLQSPTLCSTSAPLVELSQNYFDALWKKAIKVNV